MTVPLVVGHRGAAAVSPENTLVSFARGIADGADVVELDVHRTADGRLAVIHDPTIDRTAVGGRTSGAVADLTWEELGEVDLGQGQRIPELVRVLAEVSAPIHLELKAVAAAVPAAELLLETGALDRVTVTSFQIDALAAVAAHAPQIELGVIAEQPTEAALDAVRELGADSLAVRVEHLTRSLVDELHDDSVEVIGWPVRDDTDLRTALALGVDMITVDDPAWCRAALAALPTS